MSGIFNIVTEFRFDIAHAVIDSQTLQSEVEKISTTAENALRSLQRIGLSVVAQMGLGTGGVLGTLWSAIQASDKFSQSQRNLANIFLSNQAALGVQGLTFEQSMRQSEKIMDNVLHKAQGFALDPTDLLNTTKQIAPVLVSHGLDTMNLQNSIDIARGLLKSAPTLGIDTNLVQGQLTNALLGHASMNDTLFQRLVSETSPFREGKITTSQQFNALDAAKRVDILKKSLLQFGSNVDVLDGNVNSLSGRLRVFSSLIKGQFSIFKPLGDVLLKTINMFLEKINTWLAKDGKRIVESISRILETLLKDPEKLYAQIKQLAGLKGDVGMASNIVKIFGFIDALKAALTFFKVDTTKIPLLGKIFEFITGLTKNATSGAVAAFSSGGIMSGIITVLKSVGSVIFRVFLPLVFLFQIISRAIGYAQISNLKFAAEKAAFTIELIEKLGMALRKIFAPIEMAIDGAARLVSWFFQASEGVGILLTVGDKFVNMLDFIGDVMIHAISLISGVMNFLINAIGNLVTLNFADFKDIGNWASDGYHQIWDQYHTKAKNPNDLAVANQVTNIGQVNITQNIKEQVEPDRIAYSLTEQLLKIANNPTSAAGRTTKSGYVAQ